MSASIFNGFLKRCFLSLSRAEKPIERRRRNEFIAASLLRRFRQQNFAIGKLFLVYVKTNAEKMATARFSTLV